MRSNLKEEPRLIILRFPDYCRACFQPMNKGAEAMWYGKDIGVIHLKCRLRGEVPLALKPIIEYNSFIDE